MSKFPILDMDGKKTESLDLPEDIFGQRINQDVIYQAVLKYQASRRGGHASTKERGSVSGGGIKPYRQKGTGRARAGSIRSPLWQGGGVVFGPHPRSFGYSIPQKVKKVALRETLNAKYQSQDLLCVDDLTKAFQKTKEFAQFLKTLGLQGKILAILDGSDASVARVSRNIPHLTLMHAQDVNAYDVLRHKKLLMTKTAFKNLLGRIQLNPLLGAKAQKTEGQTTTATKENSKE